MTALIKSRLSAGGLVSRKDFILTSNFSEAGYLIWVTDEALLDIATHPVLIKLIRIVEQRERLDDMTSIIIKLREHETETSTT